ncbi:MAG TPA: hypothetical protein P5150_03480 [Candidatus Ratteibacteria bacterium]|nr:hypothetical protein [bacterium]HRR95778.1 hypothetical protein [Candidatus Ratteibacteria bacterium]
MEQLIVDLDSDKFRFLRWGKNIKEYPSLKFYRPFRIPDLGNIYIQENDTVVIGKVSFKEIYYGFFKINKIESEKDIPTNENEIFCFALLKNNKKENYEVLLNFLETTYGPGFLVERGGIISKRKLESEGTDVEVYQWEGKQTGIEIEYIEETENIFVRYYSSIILNKLLTDVEEELHSVIENTEENENNSVINGYTPLKCPYCGGVAKYETTVRQGSPADNINAAILGGLLTRSFFGGLLAGNMMADRNNQRVRIYRCERCKNTIEIPEKG